MEHDPEHLKPLTNRLDQAVERILDLEEPGRPTSVRGAGSPAVVTERVAAYQEKALVLKAIQRTDPTWRAYEVQKELDRLSGEIERTKASPNFTHGIID